MAKRFTLLLSLALMAGPLSCSLMKRVDLRSYPGETRTLYLHNFTNDTFQPDTNVEVTRALRDEINRRENFILVDDPAAAHLHLYGSISVFRKEGRMYDNYRNPVRYELILSARIKLRERDKGENGGYLFTKQVGARVDYSEREGFLEREVEARMRLYRLMASRINNLLESEYLSRYGSTAP